jgi:hypothetical protein
MRFNKSPALLTALKGPIIRHGNELPDSQDVFHASLRKKRVFENSLELSWRIKGCGIIPRKPPPKNGVPEQLTILNPSPGINLADKLNPPVDHPDRPVADGENPVPILFDIVYYTIIKNKKIKIYF